MLWDNLVHFFVLTRVQPKWAIWREALKELVPNAKLETKTKTKVWKILLLTGYPRNRGATGGPLLSVIGLILVSIWQYYWRCEIEGVPWSSAACLGSIRLNRWKWMVLQKPDSLGQRNTRFLVPGTTVYDEESREDRITSVEEDNIVIPKSDINQTWKYIWAMIACYFCSYALETFEKFRAYVENTYRSVFHATALIKNILNLALLCVDLGY
ncbi:hypothetical protein INT43_005803 [Umbelopsis isabellina]|uniref:Uncharacterized protein n=1 Tax=Mortierella isabellina TaxID=91625 RepID=A0A8H7PJ83_MORIS|nr:hypothetical protein INT43_005803 [Umbelopsis isabellina]